jgi:hypothetical protein
MAFRRAYLIFSRTLLQCTSNLWELLTTSHFEFFHFLVPQPPSTGDQIRGKIVGCLELVATHRRRVPHPRLAAALGRL